MFNRSVLSDPLRSSCSSLLTKKERTIQSKIRLDGVGLFTGNKASLVLCPAPLGSGIVFQRTDLLNKPLLPATLDNVHGTPRCTIIGNKEVFVQTVEHLLSSLFACNIDNVLIELSGPEVPIFDGSAKPFVQAIEKTGTLEQDGSLSIYQIKTPAYWSQGDVQLIAIPDTEYRVSYTLHYPQSKFIGSQFFSVVVDEKNFSSQISSSRTFSLYEEVAPMIEKGLIRGGSLENGVIVKDNAVLNPEGLRYDDEMVRHKILDLIGDLSLIGCRFAGHVIAIRSGHASNIAFARMLQNHIRMENS